MMNARKALPTFALFVAFAIGFGVCTVTSGKRAARLAETNELFNRSWQVRQSEVWSVR